MRVKVRDCQICEFVPVMYTSGCDAFLTRVLEAMMELSAGMYMGVRECHICQFVIEKYAALMCVLRECRGR